MYRYECEVAFCKEDAQYLVKNTGTGKLWRMCSDHKMHFTRPTTLGTNMIVISELEDN